MKAREEEFKAMQNKLSASQETVPSETTEKSEMSLDDLLEKISRDDSEIDEDLHELEATNNPQDKEPPTSEVQGPKERSPLFAKWDKEKADVSAKIEEAAQEKK